MNKKVFIMNDSECWECGIETEYIHNHHVVPRSRGGTKTVPLCVSCHTKAHHRKKNMTTSRLVREAWKRKRVKYGDDFTWGKPPTKEIRAMGLKVRKDNALAFNQHISSVVSDLRSAGYKTKDIPNRLTQMGIVSRRGKPFTYHGLLRVLRYIKKRVE